MNKELQQQLFDRYPSVFADRNKRPTETLICFGIDTGDGWFQLLDNCCAELVKVEKECGLITKAVQIKEKFGSLRFYTTGDHNHDIISFEHNTRYWIKNLYVRIGYINNWLRSFVPLCELYPKEPDGFCNFNYNASRDIRFKHAVIDFIIDLWSKLAWFIYQFEFVHYHAYSVENFSIWHRWNCRKYHRRITRAIGKAERISARTCEECGKPGKLDDSQWYVQTLCPECTEKRAKECTEKKPITAKEISGFVDQGKKIADDIEQRAIIEDMTKCQKN